MRSVFCFLFLLCAPFIQFAQLVNRFDADEKRRGKWITYHDSAKKIKSFQGRFRHGRPVGNAFYYNSRGELLKKEQNRRKRLKTIVYQPGRGKQKKGQARVQITDSLIRYFYYGKWKYYNERGKVFKYGFFENGRLVKTVYKDISGAVNDSLISYLTALENTFNKKHHELLNRIAQARHHAHEVEALERTLFNRDSLTFRSVSSIISDGYPSKEELRDAVTIPFYILSYAPASFKEVHIPVLIEAAQQGDLALTSLALFIDKMRVGGKRPQLYGTQKYLNENKELVLYPVEDAEHLEARRKKAGL